MSYRTIRLFAIVALAAFSGPSVVFGQNVNMSGTLNVNDTPVVNTTNLILSMLVSLAESIIPIIVGAAIGHKSMKYWQEKKDRIATKNNILANYAQSFKMHDALLDNFAHRVFKSYVTFGEDRGARAVPLEEYSSTEDRVSGFLKFPSDPSELPSKKFYWEYGELQNRLSDIAKAREQLYLDLKRFSKDGITIIEKLQNIKDRLKGSEILLDKFMKSTGGDDFTNCYNAYALSSNRIKSEAEKLESDLIHFSSGKPFTL